MFGGQATKFFSTHCQQSTRCRPLDVLLLWLNKHEDFKRSNLLLLWKILNLCRDRWTQYCFGIRPSTVPSLPSSAAVILLLFTALCRSTSLKKTSDQLPQWKNNDLKKKKEKVKLTDAKGKTTEDVLLYFLQFLQQQNAFLRKPAVYFAANLQIRSEN